MSNNVPTIQKFMSCDPICIDESKTVDIALKLMKVNHIRHLPVVKGQDVVGIISDRDLKLVMGLVGVVPTQLKVCEIAHSPVYKVSPQAAISEVAAEMASKHFGSAVVEDNHKLVGIFTTTDALKALTEICRQRYHLA